jgi:hypothetical protein
MLIYDLRPHMHWRGSWFKFELLFPNGQRETLLSVPRYNFNWQYEYFLKTPLKVPALGEFARFLKGDEKSAASTTKASSMWGLPAAVSERNDARRTTASRNVSASSGWAERK